MASERVIKRRIGSANNIAKITRAMQMVAASKMKRAQQKAISGRPYAEKIAEMVSRFVGKIERARHPLLSINEQGKKLIVLISTNKGLCGGLNTNLFRSFLGWYPMEDLSKYVYITIGKKGESLLLSSKVDLIADFSSAASFSDSIPAVTTLITDGYIKGEYKEVDLIYNNFISALNQEPTKKRILPISEFLVESKSRQQEREEESYDYLVEPSIDSILDTLLFHYLENQVRDCIYEAEASEHSARMIAMKNASDNANEFIDILTLEFNKARQEKITSEISDIVTARLGVRD